ncbi:MAG: manganese efflux pump [Candidatus Eremiobacteraeota bacterium]|nr:manganese efflux pump [Candidatus Eremiobacteraeota bacterium]
MMANVAIFKIIFVALSLALDCFAVSVGVGMRGVAPIVKWRIGCSFALAQIAMTLIGAAIGAALGQLIGSVAGYLGFFALLALGSYMIVESQREASLGQPLDMTKGWGLAVASLSISLDSLGIGFSILYIGVPLYTALIVIGVASVACTFAGISLGRTLGRRAEEGAELWAGIILAATGLFFIANKVFRWGI